MSQFDIVFISYDEPNKDANWEHLKERFPKAKRVDSVKGIAEAHGAAAKLAETDMFFVVDGDNTILDSFDFNYRLKEKDDEDYIHVWRARNPINGLEYGYGAIKLFPKKIFIKNYDEITLKYPWYDYRKYIKLEPQYTHIKAYIDHAASCNAKGFRIIDECASVTNFNTSEFQTWRAAFREAVKLSSKCINNQIDTESVERLNIWCSKKSKQPFADYCVLGANEGKYWGKTYANDPEKLKLINDFDWLKIKFSLSKKKYQVCTSKIPISYFDVSPTFCMLPWIHLSTRPNGHLRLCCTANASSAGATNDKKWGGEVGILKMENGKPANLNVSTLMESWNNDYMKDVRLSMLNGKIPNSCSKCFKEEASGYKSKRNWESAYWQKRIDLKELIKDTQVDGTVPTKIPYVDLRLGTKCNLKCIMCSPHDSSMWVGDWKKLYPQIKNESLKELMSWSNNGKVDGASYDWHKNNDQFWKELYDQIPNIQQLYFAGGESTIIKEHYDLLEECIQRGHALNIELRYNSNGIELPDKLFELWSHFKGVRFHISIDSVNEINEYIRHPSQWRTIEDNLRKLDNTDEKIEVTIACAVQALNIFYIPDFIKWKIEQNFKKINKFPSGAGLINFHFVYHPAHLNVKVLPVNFKKQVEKKFEDFYDWLKENYRSDEEFLNNSYGIIRLQGMVNFMNSEDWSRRIPELNEYLERMDKIRGTSFTDTFPEMKEIFN